METLYRRLAKLLGALATFFRGRADRLHTARMFQEFPFGCRVRIVCDCDDRPEDHIGDWFIFDYHADAGDFRVMRTIPLPGTNIFNEMYRHVRPERLQRVGGTP